MKLPAFQAISDLKKVTEEQFLLREFGLEIVYGEQDQSFKSTNTIIVTDNPSNWKRLLDSSPDDSLTFFLIGNETYIPHRYEYLNTFPSVRIVFIYNPPNHTPYLNIFKSLLGNILDGGLILSPASVFRDFRTSQFTRKKLRSIQVSYKFKELPQGYCNSFVDQLSTLSSELRSLLTSNCSLYSEVIKSNLRPFIEKTCDFSYIGQPITKRRETCLRIARKNYGIRTVSKKGFHGTTFDGDTTYLKNLLKTKFPLVPPGAFNNYNHRYTESLLTGGVPAILAQNSLDPSANHNWTNHLNFPVSHSYRMLLGYLSSLTKNQFELLHETTFKSDAARIQIAYDSFMSSRN